MGIEIQSQCQWVEYSCMKENEGKMSCQSIGLGIIAFEILSYVWILRVYKP